MSSNITVCFATDDNYAQHAAAAIASLLLNTQTQRGVDVYILSSGSLSELNTSRLRNLESLNPHGHIHFLSVNPAIFNDVPMGDWAVETCFRVAVPDLLPDVDRVAYIDCDTIVMGDIEELYDTDMEGCVMAAVNDVTARHCAKRLGLLCDSFCYSNAGVALMDTKQMRERGFNQLFFKWAGMMDRDEIILPDQDLINIVVCREFGAFYSLDYAWNLPPVNVHGWNKRREAEARRNPKIIHYITKVKKPWEQGVDYPYKSLYWDYVARTDYAEARDEYMKEYMKNRFKCNLYHIFNHYIWNYKSTRKGDSMRIKLFRMSVFKRVKRDGRSTSYLLGVKLPF